MAAEQKARATYDNILRMCDDPDVTNVIRYLREREVVHFQRFGDLLDMLQSKIKPNKTRRIKASSAVFFCICSIIPQRHDTVVSCPNAASMRRLKAAETE